MLYIIVKKKTTHTIEYWFSALISVSFSSDEIVVSFTVVFLAVANSGSKTKLLDKATSKI